MKGYAVNQSLKPIEDDVHLLKQNASGFNLQIKTQLVPKDGIFSEGQIFDAYIFVVDLIKTAKIHRFD